MRHESVRYAIEKYYTYWRNFAKWQCFQLGIMSWAEDILHNALVELLLNPNLQMTDSLHIKNYVVRAIKSRTYDVKRAKRDLLDIDSQYEDVPEYADSSYNGMSDEDFARFREVSCNTRCDDFIVPVNNGFYVTPKAGWVSGWVHSYVTGGRRYTYWLYSAFVGSRCKGEIPKRLNTSKSRHEAYAGLMNHNRQIICWRPIHE